MRVALINSPSLTLRPVSRSMAGGLGFDGSEHMLLPPLDLATMAATLRAAGDTVALIDADPLRLDAAGALAQLEDGAWEALVATVSLPTLEEDAAFLAALRRAQPQARVWAKTLIRDHGVLRALLERSGAHAVIHGEADLTITDLVHGRSRSGTAWLEPGADGAAPVLRFDAGEPVADLDQLPIAARDLLPVTCYTYPLLGGPVVTLQTSRGCPYPCGYYCPYPLVEGVKWRSQRPERIFAELQDVVERCGIRKIYFRDATFTLDQDRVAALCERIIAAGWRLEWVCETRVDCLGDALLETMRAAGCVGILVGVETGDEQVMHHRQGKKGLTVPKLAHLRARARALGIRLHFLLIVGLPHATRESVVATWELVQRYEPDTIGVTVITPYPGTPLYADGVREGWLESHEWKDYGGHQIPMHTPHMRRDDLVAGKRLLDEGFAILQRRRMGGPSRPLEAMARQHYDQLLRWGYGLDAPIGQLHQLAAAIARPARAPAVRSVPAISVVVPTFNRCAILRKTLLALASQTLPPEQFEVVVADDGSSDDTLVMLGGFRAPFALRVLRQPHGGANAARNLAIGAARGEIVLVTGDDMIPEPGFLEAHLRFHRTHPSELDAVLGFIDWSPEITVTPFMRHIVSPEGAQQFAFHLLRDASPDFRFFYTSNVSVKRSLLARQPMLFDPDFTYPAFDDTELGYRLVRQGMRIHFEPRAVTCHHHQIAVEGFVERQRHAGRMATVLARKHPELGTPMLGLDAILAQRAQVGAQQLATLLAVVRELEKPDLATLHLLQANGEGLDRAYTRTVLAPLYNDLLQVAYALGVCEATAVAPPAEAAKAYDVSIVIPVFNKAELTSQCLVALAAVTHGVEYEVVVVDNASSDETPELLAQLGGDVQIIRNAENLGFATACNQGARAARGRYLVFLNNDTIPLEGWLEAMVAEVEAHPDVAVVGSKLLYQDGTIQHAGVVFSRWVFSPYHLYRQWPADVPAVNRRRELQCVTGACMLVRREVFERVGGFDEGYRNGFEDVDLCLKIGEQAWKIVYQPKSVLYHLESQTPGRKAHDQENARRLLDRWADRWWLVDEDAVYLEDGYAVRIEARDGELRARVEPLDDPDARRRWETIAETQRAARRRDLARVHALLGRVEDWPHDPWVLGWGVLACGWAGVPEQAVAFWERILALEENTDARIALARIGREAPSPA